MAGNKEAYVGIDAAKLRNAIAIAEAGRDGEVRYLDEVDASLSSMRRVVARLADRYERLHFCPENEGGSRRRERVKRHAA